MANPAYDQALSTGRVLVRKWFRNNNSTKNQMTVQFQQLVDRPESPESSLNELIGLAQGSAIGNQTRVTALMSFNADRASAVLGSMEGDATMGSPVVAAEVFFNKLAEMDGKQFTTRLAIQVTENFTKNPKAPRQTAKINPTTKEVVTSLNPATGTQMPVFRHTSLVAEANCNHTFIVPQRNEVEVPVNLGDFPAPVFGGSEIID
jgi:hypothetical protein